MIVVKMYIKHLSHDWHTVDAEKVVDVIIARER